MKFSTRQVEILYYLNEYEETTLKQIAQKVNVTTQTIKAEFEALKDILKLHNIDIEFKMIKGLKVYGSNNLQQLLEISKTSVEFPIQNKIVLILILNRKFLVLQDIADQIFISKSQIEKIMPTILKQYKNQIVSIRNRGYKFSGTELERRKIFVNLTSKYFKGNEFFKHFEIFSENYLNLKEFFDQNILKIAINIVNKIISDKTISFVEQSLSELFLYLLFILKTNALTEKNLITQDFSKYIEIIKNFEEYVHIVNNINKKLNLNLNKAEKNYLSYILFVLKKHKRLNKSEILIEMKDFIEEILIKIKNSLSINLLEDEKLIDGLSYHIYTIVLTNIVFENANKYEELLNLKNQYPLGYEMAILTSILVKERFNQIMDEYNIACLSLHFQTAIERLKQEERSIKTFLICDFGQAVHQLINVKIQRLYPEIHIEKVYSVQEFLALKNTNYDLILSTEALGLEDIKIIYITPALKEIELKRILDFIRTRNTGFMIQDKIRNATIINIEDKIEKDNLILNLTNYLKYSGSIDEKYLKSVYEREKISSTALNYIALPHGNPEFVNETKLIIARLKNFVKWNNEKIKCVFLLTVTKELLNQNSRFFTTFYKKVAQLEFEEQLIKIEDYDNQKFKDQLIRLFN